MHQHRPDIADSKEPTGRSMLQKACSKVRLLYHHAVLAGLLVATLCLGATPGWALFMTPLPDYDRMSTEQQTEIITTTVFEMIHYFNNVKHDGAKAVCVGEYFSGSIENQDGGYYHFNQRLDELRERQANGAIESPEELYVERVILKLIKEKCGV